MAKLERNDEAVDRGRVIRQCQGRVEVRRMAQTRTTEFCAAEQRDRAAGAAGCAGCEKIFLAAATDQRLAALGGTNHTSKSKPARNPLTRPHRWTISTQLAAADRKIRCSLKGWLPVN